MDYQAFRSLCRDDEGAYRASKALSVLWQAGNRPQQFEPLAASLPGGLLGGLLSCGLTALAGETGGTILLISGFLAEIILLFKFSLTDMIAKIGGLSKHLRISRAKQPAPSGEVAGLSEEQRAAERIRLRNQYLEKYRGQAPPTNFPPDCPNNLPLREGGAPFTADEPSSASFSPDTTGTQDGDAKAFTPQPPEAAEPLPPQSLPEEQPLQLTGSEDGFLQVGDVTPQGATLVNPDDPGLLSGLPVWNAGPDITAEEPSHEPLIRPEPIFSYDADFGKEQAPVIGEDDDSDRAASDQGIKNLDRSLFQVPPFLQPEQRSEYDPFEESFDEPFTESQIPEITEESPVPSKPQVRTVYGPRPEGRSGSDERIVPIRAIRSSGQAEPPTAGIRPRTSAPEAASSPAAEPKAAKTYVFPPTSLLAEDKNKRSAQNNQVVQSMSRKLEETLNSFGVAAKVINITTGPSIMRFELSPGPGVKVSRIVSLADDIALSLAAVGLRIEAPIPGKSAIGIEIPNRETQLVPLRSLIESREFKESRSPLSVALGRDIPGSPIICDLTKMPHLLIAGATGSGKSVCINSILISLLYRCTPDQVRLLLIDPKVVELSVYNGIPHLLAPVVTDPKKAANTLNWAVVEMDRRYNEFAKFKVRDLRAYNRLAAESDDPEMPHMPLILVVIDELADLMMTAPGEVEEAIARLTAKARAAGIHLIIATQRPSVDVITGLIKANIPSRIAFAVSSHIDSRTILDIGGAEKLLGKGDMLYYPQSSNKPLRGQGALVTDREVEDVLSFVRRENESEYDDALSGQITADQTSLNSNASEEEEDELLPEAVELFLDMGHASIALCSAN